jgi:Common central domain of tyrosinase
MNALSNRWWRNAAFVLSLVLGPDSAWSQSGPSTATKPTRTRLEVFETNQNLVSSLQRGVAAMKARKPSDPRSWFFQAAIHGVTPEAVAEAQLQDPGVAQVDQARFWNRCPHFPGLQAVSADFLVWHRAYLYHFERILRAAAEDPMLALPYWNYLDPAQLGFPRLYADPVGDPPTNPLYDARRENAFTLGVLQLNPAAVNTTRAFAETRFFGPVASLGFAGSAGDLEPSSQGLIERNPHNLLHFAIGGFIGSDPAGTNGAGGLMSEVPTAAFDPIFWAHHSNIDRLWSVWECLPGRVWGNAPAAAWFTAQPWWFYDVEGGPQNNQRAFYMSQKALGLSFDTDDETCARLSDKLPTETPIEAFNLVAVVGGAAARPETRQSVVLLGSRLQPVAVSAREPTRVALSIAAKDAFGAKRIREAFPQAQVQAGKRRAFLVLDGVRYEGVPSASYAVYVNPPPGEIPDLEGPGFVGVLALFGTRHADRGGHGHGGGDGHTDVFDVTGIVGGTDAGEATVEVVFKPVPLLVAKDAKAIVRATSRKGVEGVTVKFVRVVAAEAVARPR